MSDAPTSRLSLAATGEGENLARNFPFPANADNEAGKGTGGGSLILTLDVGTSSARAMLWDTQGNPVESVAAQRPYQMRTTPDGGVEMDAGVLFQHVAACLDEAMAEAGPLADNIVGVGVTTFWHSLLGLDADGNPATPIYNWSDTRSGPAARRLRAELDGAAVHARTGCVLHPSYYPAKLAWLRETQPELFFSVARWVSPSEYLWQRLFGLPLRELRASISIASGTGLYNHARAAWDETLLAHLGVPPEKLSPLCDLRDTARGLAPEFTARWPALKEVPFIPAVGDGAASNIGSGGTGPTRAAINLGTSGAIRIVGNPQETDATSGLSSPPPPGFWRYRIDAARPMTGTAFSDGGHVMAWMRKTLHLPPNDELIARLEAMEPGAHGLTFLPFLAGERGLGWNPNARAAFVGMNLDTDAVEMARAAMEGVTLRFALAAERLRKAFPTWSETIVSGGAFGHFPFWAGMITDALGQPVTMSGVVEATSRGAALLALETLGIVSDAGTLPATVGSTLLPNPARTARYRELLARQQELYARLVEQGD